MRLTYAILSLFLLISIPLQAQQQSLFAGTVVDGESKEALVGVALYFPILQKGGSTDDKGNFRIKLPNGLHQLTVTYLGYQAQKLELELKNDTLLIFALQPQAIQTAEVVVSDQRLEENITQSVDKISLSQEEIERLPYLLGEVDPLKMLQLLPGVQTNGEGNNGFFVRGGGIDQNLILFDQTPVYNTGHLFGFFSLFNNAVIEEVNLIKGGIPAAYGGRLSSILEINSRRGNRERFAGEGRLGFVSGNFSLEGPLKKGKSSFLLSGRRTYIDLISKAISNDPTIFNSGIDYYFDDLNAKVNFQLSDNDQLDFSAFAGSDNFLFKGKHDLTNRINWKNQTASLHWEHFYQPKNYHRLSLLASNYEMDFSAGISDYSFQIHSAIQDYGLKAAWHIGSIPGHQLSFGLEYLHHALIPNNVRAQGTDVEFSMPEQEKLNNQEQALYIQDEWKLHDKLSLAGGLRLSAYQQLGPFTRFISDKSLTLQDTIYYHTNEIVQAWQMLDPRFSLTYRIQPQASIKASVEKMHQYLHMAPVSSVSLPTDVWVPSSARIRPQTGWQYSLAYHRNLQENSIETSLSAYYKQMNHQLEYRDGVIVGYSKGFTYDDNFIFGKGMSYGLEAFIKKNTGNLQGWLSYTLSKTTRTFEEINDGQAFAAKYDRLHNLSLVSSYQFNERWSVSGVFVYATGNAMTLPLGRYIIGGNIINEYQGRNTFRMPSYHRLDLSTSYQLRKRANFESNLSLSVYNAYNRKNPYYIYFSTEGNVNDYYLKVSLEEVSLFPIIPSLAYQVKF